MAITVKSEIIVPAAGKPCYEQRTQLYLDADGLRRRETGNIELYLSKVGQDDARHEFDCETWKYTITID